LVAEEVQPVTVQAYLEDLVAAEGQILLPISEGKPSLLPFYILETTVGLEETTAVVGVAVLMVPERRVQVTITAVLVVPVDLLQSPVLLLVVAVVEVAEGLVMVARQQMEEEPEALPVEPVETEIITGAVGAVVRGMTPHLVTEVLVL
jgi:hypothetical protein